MTDLQEYFNNFLSVDPDSGVLTWKSRSGKPSFNSLHAGKPALSCINAGGYMGGAIEGKSYYAHRVCAIIYFGEQEGEVDHINGCKTDNRRENLRFVTRSENQRNAKKRVDNTSGLSGVFLCHITNKWAARAKVNGKTKRIGTFESKRAAANARRRFNEGNGYTERHGR